MSNDQQIEQGIVAKGLTAPRVTPADIEANIDKIYYFTALQGAKGAGWIESEGDRHETLGLLTFCVLVLRNGFTVTGESACASPENFNAEIGRKIARDNAVNKVWPLMGYALKERLANTPPPADNDHVAPDCERFRVVAMITFDGFVQHGRDQGVPLTNGMPWSFTYKGYPVTHENDKRYLVGVGAKQLNFTPDDVLCTLETGELWLRPLAKSTPLMPNTKSA